MTDKTAIRAAMKAVCPPPAASAAICRRILALPEFRRAQWVLGFFPMASEPNIRPVLEAVLAQGKRLCLPRCLAGRQLGACAVTDLAQLQPDVWGIPAPPTDAPAAPHIDLALVPGVAFDRACRRLGHGAGYYDRFLETFMGVSAGVCFSGCLLEQVPVDAHDRPVDLVVTETGLLRNEVQHV